MHMCTARLLVVLSAAWASLGAVSARPDPGPTATTAGRLTAAATATRTVVWSTTETSVTYPAWIGPTVVTMVTTQTVTTLIPDAAVGPGAGAGAGVVESVVGRTTYEFRMTFSDGHSSTSWSSATHSYWSTVGV